jgi:hypothetical protein
MRESVLASITDVSTAGPVTSASTTREALRSISTALGDDDNPLTPGKRALMRELLARLADE